MSKPILRSTTPVIDIYIKLAQYPILSDTIRTRMRDELFRRGIVSHEDFEQEVASQATDSQKREGLQDPFGTEETSIWQQRKAYIRAYLTDSYFANNLGAVLFDEIIREVRADQPVPSETEDLKFNPEIAPWRLLFRQGEIYEQWHPDKQKKVEHHLVEIKVVLIKRLISDQLKYIGIAKHTFTIADLKLIYNRRIGSGKVGGKSAGLLLAWRLLQKQTADNSHDISKMVEIPDSFFLGTEVIYEFRLMNEIDKFMNQKYLSLEEVREQYPAVMEAHLNGRFPKKIMHHLRELLDKMGNDPIIVRSSSLLEDNFGFSFAGKYTSYFCPNQGTPEENLEDLLNNIKRVFASTLNPDALLYRKKHGLLDYDERMAVLIQRVRGKRHGKYYYPTLAGVAFSQNPFRWNDKIKREDGFLRLVWGMGTRAVDRVANDYPRLISLSHPQLRPETTARAISQYSQYFIDLIDLETNSFETLPVEDVLPNDKAELRYIASLYGDNHLQDILSISAVTPDKQIILTFNYLTKNKKFISLMRTALKRLEQAYKLPVDVEFIVEIIPSYPYPDFKLHLVQCRPLSQREHSENIKIPKEIPAEKILFTGHRLIPDGKAEGVRYIIYVDPEKYRVTPFEVKSELGRIVSRLNHALDGESYILMGPGRWGSVNLELGVPVSYADIHNTKVLIEMALAHNGQMPELSYGTHFFQDLVEAGIHALPLHLGQGKTQFNWDFFRHSPNCLADILPQDAKLSDYIRVIDVTAVSPNHRLNILMDGSNDEAIGYLAEGEWENQQGQAEKEALIPPY